MTRANFYRRRYLPAKNQALAWRLALSAGFLFSAGLVYAGWVILKGAV
jgi:hypothetical protein